MSTKNAVRFLFVSFTLSIFLSCASLSPVGPARERAVSFAEIEAVKPDWQPYVAGIDYYPGKIVKPRLEFWALRIDLAAPDLRVTAKGGASNDGNILSTKVSSFVRQNGLAAGINALPFSPVSGREGEARTNVGVVISDGIMISAPHSRYDALVFYSDGTVSIVSQAEILSVDNIENAVGGFRQILKDNELVERVLNLEPRHPRSAAGISADGQYLYLLVIDGRRIGSIGSTEAETALVLRALGAWDGINFDGGGSSSLALCYPDGKIRPVNTPIHKGVLGRERAVAGCLGIAVQ